LVDFGENGGTVTFKANGNCPLQVGVMTDPNDASTFTMYEEVPITPEFAEYTVTINAAGTGHIAIKHSNESPVQVLFVDDVTYEKVVPVELTSFTANVKNNGEVELQWRTSTETNNRGFEIERQVSSKQKSVSSQWERVGYAAGHGTTTEPNSYNFTDKEVKSGKYSYRLKQIDYDGSYEYSGTVEVELNMPEEFELSQNYPNPFNPATRIKYGTPQDGYISLKVYNTLGEEIAELVHGFTKAGNHEVTFNAGNLSSGIYIYKLESVNKVLVKKMMVLR
jgi:hypothetical protein